MRNYKLCIATPMYNAEKYLERIVPTIGSGVTWLVRNDGSTDGTQEKLQTLCKQYNIDLKLWSGENRGLTYGRNFLSDQFVNNPELQEFTHMVFIDADDYFAPGWEKSIHFWLEKVTNLFPNEKTPYLCFKYWNERRTEDECQIYTKLNTEYKAHPAICQYPGGGFDLLHVIPREYLIEVKEFDGNYYHVVKDEKWTPDCHNFMSYTAYKASFISDIVAILGTNEGNMSDTYFDNIVTKYAKGQLDEALMFMDIYGTTDNPIGCHWYKVPAFRWRWYLQCLTRMIKNGTLVPSGKKWDNFQGQPDELVESKHRY